MTRRAAPPPFAVGDTVMLLDQPAGRKELRPGLRGEVVCAGGAPWGLVSVEVLHRTSRKVWLLHPRHLQRVAASDRAAPPPASPPVVAAGPAGWRTPARPGAGGGGRVS